MGVRVANTLCVTSLQLMEALTAVMVLIQCIAQIVALLALRGRQPDLHRPYRMTLFPLPAIVALLGWCYVYYATVNVDKYGNTSSASIPIALNEAIEAGRVKDGSTVMMVAFGAGFTWASMIIRF